MDYYLSKLKLQCLVWIQVTKETAENWKHEKKPAEFNKHTKGYSCLSNENIQMLVEFHVDDHSC